ncbi:hypothetical protein DA2_1789 [Desulfovibrio sp. A2]|nr:hypothetical protein DA2_1789 [Desulfovibrio sp. A2]
MQRTVSCQFPNLIHTPFTGACHGAAFAAGRPEPLSSPMRWCRTGARTRWKSGTIY